MKAPSASQMYVDGDWVDARDGGLTDIVNPATEDVIGAAPNAGREDMKRAIEAARKAFDEGPWPRMGIHDRSRIIRQIADNLEKNKEGLWRLLVAEAAAESITRRIQLDGAVQFAYDAADWALKFKFQEMLPPAITSVQNMPARVSNAMVYRQPVGVCGIIPTWNYPLHVTMQGVPAALATGCTIVLKPSPYAPLINLEVARLIQETDLPKGVFNVVTGEGVDIAEELVANPLVDHITFTGSVATGKRIMEKASRNLKRLHLELGGKSANIVLEDADVDLVAPMAATPAYVHSGQGCAMATRVLVSRAHHDKLVQGMVRFLQSFVKIGDPADPSVTMGPLIREERRLKVEEYILSGREQGAALAIGGRRPPGLDRGYFLEPTVFAEARNEMRISQEEIFGPVVAVIPYDDIEDAIRMANDTAYGLAASITTTNVPRGLEIAKRLRSGTVNVGAAYHPSAPFGGFKESGLGRTGGRYGIEEYTEIQAITWGS